VIKSFLHKGLEELFKTGKSSRVPPLLQNRCMARLEALNGAKVLTDLNLPGYYCHPLKPSARYAISINGPWRITFEWATPHAYRVDIEQYH
jgi:proteic killer suppression protein